MQRFQDITMYNNRVLGKKNIQGFFLYSIRTSKIRVTPPPSLDLRGHLEML